MHRELVFPVARAVACIALLWPALSSASVAPGAADFGAPTEVSGVVSAGGGSGFNRAAPAVGVDAAGRVLVVYRQEVRFTPPDAAFPEHSSARIVAVSDSGGRMYVSDADDVLAGGRGDVGEPVLAVNAAGAALAAWHGSPPGEGGKAFIYITSGTTSAGFPSRPSVAIPSTFPGDHLAAAVSPQGDRLVAWAEHTSGGGRVVRVWDGHTVRDVSAPGQDAGLPSVAFGPAGEAIVSWGACCSPGHGARARLRPAPEAPWGPVESVLEGATASEAAMTATGAVIAITEAHSAGVVRRDAAGTWGPRIPLGADANAAAFAAGGDGSVAAILSQNSGTGHAVFGTSAAPGAGFAALSPLFALSPDDPDDAVAPSLDDVEGSPSGAALAATSAARDVVSTARIRVAPMAPGGGWGPVTDFGPGGAADVALAESGAAAVAWQVPLEDAPYSEIRLARGTVTSMPPYNTDRPRVVVPTTSVAGETIRCEPGTWRHPGTFTYIWLRDGVPIAGATSAEFVLRPGDTGVPISCRVTSTNPWGSGTAASEPIVGTDRQRSHDIPVIFIPGFMASIISCTNRLGSEDELWPDALFSNSEFAFMQLAADGRSPRGSSRCAQTAGPRDVLQSIELSSAVTGAAGALACVGLPTACLTSGPAVLAALTALGSVNIHGDSTRWLQRVAPGRAYTFGWDWRRSPEDSLERLDRFIEAVRARHGVDRVAIWNHSYGGLLTRWYIDEPARAAKVARVANFASPFWGSLKPWLPIARGFESPLGGMKGAMDYLIRNTVLKETTRNLTGIYFLLPSDRWYRFAPAALRHWLEIRPGFEAGIPGGVDPRATAPAVVRSVADAKRAIRAVRGNADLVQRSSDERARHIEGFKGRATTGVDWRVFAGAGEPTLGHLREGPTLSYSWVNGDGTVPLVSQRQFTSAPSADATGEFVDTYYFCGIGHMEQPENEKLQDALLPFLLNGHEPVVDGRTLASDACPLGENEIVITGDEDVRSVTIARAAEAETSGGAARAAGKGTTSAAAARAAAAPASRPMSLAAAESAGFVEVVERRLGRTVFVTRGTPVTLTLKRGQAVSVRPLDGDAKPDIARRYGPTRGAFTLRASGRTATARHRGKSLTARALDRRAPVTRLTVQRAKAGRLIVRATARDDSGVLATHVRVGKGPWRVLRGPLRIRAKDRGRVRVRSVDVFGNAERPRRAPAPARRR